MPTKDAGEIPVLDENTLEMLADHSCCGGVEDATGIEQTGLPEERQQAGEPAPSAAEGVGELAGADVGPGGPAPVAPGYVAAKRSAPHAGFRVRLAGFLAIGLLVLGSAVWLARPMDVGEQVADYTVEMSMSGFTPRSLAIPAGKAVTLKLVNKESPFHASGAEHQFAVDALDIDEILDAKQVRVITIPAQKSGEYTFYCDVCCGGQQSPNMRGTLTFQ